MTIVEEYYKVTGRIIISTTKSIQTMNKVKVKSLKNSKLDYTSVLPGNTKKALYPVITIMMA